MLADFLERRALAEAGDVGVGLLAAPITPPLRGNRGIELGFKNPFGITPPRGNRGVGLGFRNPFGITPPLRGSRLVGGLRTR